MEKTTNKAQKVLSALLAVLMVFSMFSGVTPVAHAATQHIALAELANDGGTLSGSACFMPGSTQQGSVATLITGNLALEAEWKAIPVPAVSNVPKIGDESNLWLYGGLFAVSAIAIAALFIVSTKRKKDKTTSRTKNTK